MVRGRAYIAFLFFIVAFCASASHTHAQDPAGIRIMPAQIEDIAAPSSTISETLSITNTDSDDRTFYIYKKEIKGVEDGGTPIFAEPGAEVTGYEITEWIDVESTEIFVEAGAQVNLKMTITVPENASPGSHFGAVLVSAEPPRLREIGAGVGYEVASIISLRVEGDIVDDARIRSLSTDKLIYGSKDVTFTARIENLGNIMIRPRGPLEITNMFGQKVYSTVVNDSLAGVFPGTTRNLSFKWSEDEIGFGRYEAIVALSYDGDGGKKTIDAATTFWILPTKIIIPVILGIVTLVGLIYLFTRLYAKRVIAKATVGRHIVSRRYRRRVGISKMAFVFVTLFAVMAVMLIALLIILA